MCLTGGAWGMEREVILSQHQACCTSPRHSCTAPFSIRMHPQKKHTPPPFFHPVRLSPPSPAPLSLDIPTGDGPSPLLLAALLRRRPSSIIAFATQAGSDQAAFHPHHHHHAHTTSTRASHGEVRQATRYVDAPRAGRKGRMHGPPPSPPTFHSPSIPSHALIPPTSCVQSAGALTCRVGHAKSNAHFQTAHSFHTRPPPTEEEVQTWVEGVLQEPFPIDQTFAEALKDGTRLCRLLNTVKVRTSGGRGMWPVFRVCWPSSSPLSVRPTDRPPKRKRDHDAHPPFSPHAPTTPTHKYSPGASRSSTSRETCSSRWRISAFSSPRRGAWASRPSIALKRTTSIK